MLLQYWALLNPLHGSLMRSCTGGRHTYLCLSIFFCTLFANFTDFQYFVLHWNILKLFQSSSLCQPCVPAPGIVYCHPASLQQNLDSIKIIDFRNGFSLWPGLIFAPLTRPTPATNILADKIGQNLQRLGKLTNIFVSFQVGEYF